MNTQATPADDQQTETQVTDELHLHPIPFMGFLSDRGFRVRDYYVGDLAVNTTVKVLPELYGLKWDYLALMYVTSLDPTLLRVVNSSRTYDTVPGRITVQVDQNLVIVSIEMEVSIRAPAKFEVKYPVQLAELLRHKQLRDTSTEVGGTQYDYMEEAVQCAAQCWCDTETSDRVMDPELCTAVAKRISKWMQLAAIHERNAAHWMQLAATHAENEAHWKERASIAATYAAATVSTLNGAENDTNS